MFSMTKLSAPKVGQQVPLEVAGSRDFLFRAPIALLACVLDLFDGRQHRSPYWGCVKDDEGICSGSRAGVCWYFVGTRAQWFLYKRECWVERPGWILM